MINMIKKLTLLSVLTALLLLPVNVTLAATAAELKNSRDYYAAQAAAAAAAAQQKKQQAEQVKVEMNKVNTEIDKNTSAIDSTNSQISDTQTKIDDLKKKIQEQNDNLAREKDNMGKIVASWYMEGEDGLLTALLGSENLSKMVDKQQYYDSIKQQIQTSIDNIKVLQEKLDAEKNEQDRQMSVLEGLKQSQLDQQKNLENQRWVKNRLLNDTTAMINELNQDAKASLNKVAELQAKINALTATKRWGGQITSANDGSWYFSQLDPAYANSLLSPSPFTIGQYGCLITSLAMISTYYGNRLNPVQAVDRSSFNGGGYLMYVPFVNDGGSQMANWDVIDSELASGHPVVIGLNLGIDIGNYGGVSHFVVLKPYSKNGDRYLMHDSLGDGRGYNLSQVKVMRIVR